MMHFERNAESPGVVRIEMPETPTAAVDDYTVGWFAAAQALATEARGNEENSGTETEGESGFHYAHADKDALWQNGRDGTADAPKPTSADIQIDSQAGAFCIRVAGEQAVRLQGETPTPRFYALWKRHKARLKAAGIRLIQENGRWKVRVHGG